MKHLVRLYTILFLLFVNIDLFAQAIGPGDDDGGGCLECEDAPINGQLIWLLIIGITFVFFFLKRYRKVNSES